MNCRKCKAKGKTVAMIESKAISQTCTSGAPDFPGDKYGITLSLGGPGKLIDCLKCPECGWSVSV